MNYVFINIQETVVIHNAIISIHGGYIKIEILIGRQHIPFMSKQSTSERDIIIAWRDILTLVELL